MRQCRGRGVFHNIVLPMKAGGAHIANGRPVAVQSFILSRCRQATSLQYIPLPSFNGILLPLKNGVLLPLKQRFFSYKQRYFKMQGIDFSQKIFHNQWVS